MGSCCDINAGIVLKLHAPKSIGIHENCTDTLTSSSMSSCRSSIASTSNGSVTKADAVATNEAETASMREAEAARSSPSHSAPSATTGADGIDGPPLGLGGGAKANGAGGGGGDAREPPPRRSLSGPADAQGVSEGSVSYADLDRKYTKELQFMLREFQKLEQQLLWKHPGTGNKAQLQAKRGEGEGDGGDPKDGSQPQASATEESAASRNRREKLQSFIRQLQDIMKQIRSFTCSESEDAKKAENEKSPSSMVQGVRQMEKHIVVNILPVKQRLLKQLSAQGHHQHRNHRHHSRTQVTGYPNGTSHVASGGEANHKKGGIMPFAFASTSRLKGGSSLTQKLYGVNDKTSKKASVPACVPPATTSASASTNSDRSNQHESPPGMVSPHLVKAWVSVMNSSGGAAEDESAISVSQTSQIEKETPTPKALVPDAANVDLEPPDTSCSSPTPTSKQPDVSATSTALAVPPTNTAQESCKLPTPEEAVSCPESAVSTSGATRMTSKDSSKPTPSGLNAMKIDVSPPLIKIPIDNVVPQKQVQDGSASGVAKIVGPVPVPVPVPASAVASPAKRSKKRKRKKHRRKHFHSNNHVMMGTVGHSGAHHSRDAHHNSSSNKMPAFSTFCCRKNSNRSVEYVCASCNEVYPLKASAAVTPISQQPGTKTKSFVNPWWALRKEACPKCNQVQIPRIDIAAPANYMEYHPALLAHITDDSGGGGGGHHVGGHATNIASGRGKPLTVPDKAKVVPPPSSQGSSSTCTKLNQAPCAAANCGVENSSSGGSDDDEYTDGSGYTDSGDEDASTSSHDEDFGSQYTGPKLDDLNAARILILMDHASTCPGRHKNEKHAQVCRSTKYLMLHVRDCPGTLVVHNREKVSNSASSEGPTPALTQSDPGCAPKGANASSSKTGPNEPAKPDKALNDSQGSAADGAAAPTRSASPSTPGSTSIPCPFPWCRPIKHLLYHLVSCTSGKGCRTCHPKTISDNMATLTSLNAHRRKKRRIMADAAIKEADIAVRKEAEPDASKSLGNPNDSSASNTAKKSDAPGGDSSVVPLRPITAEGLTKNDGISGASESDHEATKTQELASINGTITSRSEMPASGTSETG